MSCVLVPQFFLLRTATQTPPPPPPHALPYTPTPTQGGAHTDLTRTLEAEVERQLVSRLLPPLRQLRLLRLNWDILTHGPPPPPPAAAPGAAAVAAAGVAAGAAAVAGANGGRGVGRQQQQQQPVLLQPARWPFPVLPHLQELHLTWMRDVSAGGEGRGWGGKGCCKH